MDRLWSPWRLDYVTGHAKTAGCVFCEAPHHPEQRALIVHEGRRCYVILNLYPYNNGHLMVVPFRHVPSLTSLSPEELHETARLMQVAEAVLEEAYRPHGLNVGVNLGKAAGAGVLEHIHVHLVPRWNGDSNFMTIVGDTRVLPEDLASASRRLRPLFARLTAVSPDAGTPAPAESS